MMLTITEHWFSMAIFAFILSELFIAAVRACHMCHPFNQNPDYYYPERKDATLLHLCALILLPKVIYPHFAGAWIYMNAYFVILVPFGSGYLLYKYFGSIKQWEDWKKSTYFLAVPFSLTIIALFLITILPSWNISPSIEKSLHILVNVEGAVSSAFCLRAIYQVYSWLRLADEDYSNVDDFPINYTKKILLVPFIQLGTIWISALMVNKMVSTVALLILSVVNIITLLWVLSPQRSLAIQKTQKAERSSIDIEKEEDEKYIPQDKVGLIIACIKKVVEEEQGYLNPNLSLQDIADRCQYGRTYVSQVFKNQFGGFFNYVNTLRLNHSEVYQKNHPMATIDEIATASGFTSRQSLYRVRQRLKKQQAQTPD